MRYFAYGTLMDPEVRAAVLGVAAKRLGATPATLWGYHCVRVAGATYPALRRNGGARVAGLVLDGIDSAMARRLADYEGKEYVLRGVTVATRGGVWLWVHCFMARRRPPGGLPWDSALWRRRHKNAFLRRLRA